MISSLVKVAYKKIPMNDKAIKRLTILSDYEIKQIYHLPIFSQKDREIYFTLNSVEMDDLKTFHSAHAKLYFILQLGYFKCKKKFFTFGFNDVQADAQYILERYLSATKRFYNRTLSKPTRLQQQNRILSLYNYQICSSKQKTDLGKRAYQIASICSKPIFIFKELLTYLENKRIILPGYTVMQDIVTTAITKEGKRLAGIIDRHLFQKDCENLENLMKLSEDGLYVLTLLKKEPKDFSYKEISIELKRYNLLKELYELALRFLPKTEISNDNIRYYASLVNYYTIYKLKRMKKNISYFYLICFAFSRYQCICDNLIKTFCYYVNQLIKEAKQAAKEKIYEFNTEGSKYFEKVSNILNLFIDSTIPDDTEFNSVRKMAFQFIEKERIPAVSAFISRQKLDRVEYEWEYYNIASQRFKINLRPLFMNFDFKSHAQTSSLIKAIIFLQNNFLKNKRLKQIAFSKFPKKVIPTSLSRYILNAKLKEINADKYEFLVYKLIKEKLESGEIFIQESLSYKSFKEDLINDKQWENRENIIKDCNLNSLNRPIDEILNTFKEELENLFDTVNRKIKQGENKYIKVKKSKDNITWSLSYKKKEIVNNPIYADVKHVNINDILNFTNQHCDFMSCFTHVLDKYVRTEADNRIINACIIGYGTNMGIGKMAEISDLSFTELTSSSNNFIRLETLRNANDKIVNAIANLPIFEYYNIREGSIYSSSDGQKYETQLHTINSRYSPKYFGLSKGITIYSMLANHVPVNAKVIGSHEHESHYVLDLLYNNTTNINPVRHSTDNHGTNEVNFILLYFFNYMFAPRYRNISGKAKMIYGFKNANQYLNFFIKPVRKINKGIMFKSVGLNLSLVKLSIF